MKFKKEKVKWLLRLPEGMKVSVEKGEVVEVGAVLASLTQNKVALEAAPDFLSSWSRDKIDGWIGKIVDKDFSEGELMGESGGMFSKKFYAPRKGKFAGLDEFGRMKFETGEVEILREILAPIKLKVVRVGKHNLVLEFEGLKIKGKGIGDKRVWGEVNPKVIKVIMELNFAMSGQLVLLDHLNRAMLIKSEVLGLGGLILKENSLDDWSEIDVPAIVLSDVDWENLAEIVAEKKWMAFLSSKKGKLFLVIQ